FIGGEWRPQGDSNPCYCRERAVSWASRRWGRMIRCVRHSSTFLARNADATVGSYRWSFEPPLGSCSSSFLVEVGGARRDRTADLLHAMQALSQLSYSPPQEARNVCEATFGVKKLRVL